ncbi:MAG: hypothetical protein ABNH26_11380 [Celeribacter sp.]|jgi:uncharacterized membrane protein
MSASITSLILASVALSGVGVAVALGLNGIGLVALWAGMAAVLLTLRAVRTVVQDPSPIPVPVRVRAEAEDQRRD